MMWEANLKISIQATMVTAAIFSATYLSVAINGTGLCRLGRLRIRAQMAGARGFAWFWTSFSQAPRSGLGLLAWWMLRTYRENDDA